MALEHVSDPFAEAPVGEVQLDRSPLQVALFQISFPRPVTSLRIDSVRNRLSELLASEYPYADEQPVFQMIVQPGQVPVQQESQIKTFVWTDSSQQWTLNVAPDTLSLSTSAYESREDFLNRSRRVFEVVFEVAKPPPISRIGLRYINRLVGESAMDDVLPHVVPEVRSVRDVVQSSSSGQIQHLMTDLSYVWPEGGKRIQARWGQLPPDVVIDGTLAPVSAVSWTLDIDSVIEGEIPFIPSELEASLRDLSERSYRVFRWIMTPDALRRLGAHDDNF